MSRRLVALLSVLGTLVFIAVAGPVSSASAFAWKDECYVMAHNGTVSTARLVSWLPAPPIPGTSPAIVATYIAIGLPPGRSGMFLGNTGTPVTWGCHGAIVYATHAGTLTCSYSAPSRGGNSFGCNGVRHTTRWAYDDDDIYIDLLFDGPVPTVFPRPRALTAAAPAAAPSPSPPAAPSPGSSPAKSRIARQSVLRARDLPGSGWATTTDIARAGRLGQLWTAGDLPRRCADGDNSGEMTPPGASGSLLVREGGREAAGSLVVVERDAASAKRHLAEAMTPRSIGCLAALMRSSGARTGGKTTATVRRVSSAGYPAGAKAYRITVAGRSGKPAHLDVVATRSGETWALFVFFDGTGRPFDDTHAAVIDVDRRID